MVRIANLTLVRSRAKRIKSSSVKGNREGIARDEGSLNSRFRLESLKDGLRVKTTGRVRGPVFFGVFGDDHHQQPFSVRAGPEETFRIEFLEGCHSGACEQSVAGRFIERCGMWFNHRVHRRKLVLQFAEKWRIRDRVAERGSGLFERIVIAVVKVPLGDSGKTL